MGGGGCECGGLCILTYLLVIRGCPRLRVLCHVAYQQDHRFRSVSGRSASQEDHTTVYFPSRDSPLPIQTDRPIPDVSFRVSLLFPLLIYPLLMFPETISVVIIIVL